MTPGELARRAGRGLHLSDPQIVVDICGVPTDGYAIAFHGVDDVGLQVDDVHPWGGPRDRLLAAQNTGDVASDAILGQGQFEVRSCAFELPQ